MSYYEDVYLARLNQNGTTRQERVLSQKEKQFDAFIEKSIYKVNFSCDDINYVGSLQPAHGDEKDIVSHMLTSNNINLNTGSILNITNGKNIEQKWLITYKDNNPARSHNKYKVYLLDRILTWWDSDKVSHEAFVSVASSKDGSVKDIFNNISGKVSNREASNFVHVIMTYNKDIKQDTYCLLNGSQRSFIVSGFDCETVPNVQYTTLDITMVRDEESQSTTPTSFWG